MKIIKQMFWRKSVLVNVIIATVFFVAGTILNTLKEICLIGF